MARDAFGRFVKKALATPEIETQPEPQPAPTPDVTLDWPAPPVYPDIALHFDMPGPYQCKYSFGDPKLPGFHYCCNRVADAAATGFKSTFCQEHYLECVYPVDSRGRAISRTSHAATNPALPATDSQTRSPNLVNRAA